jgi:predicted DNA-binding protein
MVKNKTFRIDDEHETKLKDLAKSNGVFESKIIELGIDEIFNKYNLSDHGISQNFEKRV